MDRAVKAAWASIGIGLLVLGLKFLAYRLTGSIALYSDALESVVNVAAAAASVIVLRVSVLPADANHPYGHHKAEYFAAVGEGVLIILAALAILRQAYLGMLDPRPLDAPALGLAINVVASVVNGGWSWFLIRSGRRWRNPALEADGRHLQADVVTSAGVVVGVSLAVLTGWALLDPALAGLVALHVLWSGWRLVRGSVAGLMDEAPPPDVMDRIRTVISDYGGGALEAHDLRTRHAGRATFIDFHLVVPGDMRVADAHAICDRIEDALEQDIPGATIVIHVEPEQKAKQQGIPVL